MDIVGLSNPSSNRPGIGGVVLLAETSWITAYGAAATLTNYGDDFRITGDHTFATGKGFVEVETEEEVATLNIPVTGQRSSLGYKPELNLYLPSLDPERLAFAIENKGFILLVQAYGCGSGQYIQMGDACNPVRMLPSDGFNSGVAGGNDGRGFKLKMGSNYSVYSYEGDVTLYGA